MFIGESLEDQELPVNGSALQDMSGNPLFCLTDNSEQGLKVIETE